MDRSAVCPFLGRQRRSWSWSSRKFSGADARQAHASALRRHKTLCKRSSAIEAMIGHLKSEHRLGTKDIKGSVGDTHNALLAGMGFNLMLLLRELVGNFLGPIRWEF